MNNEQNEQLEITLTQSISLSAKDTSTMISKKKLELCNQDEAIYLDPSHILYIEADGNYCDIHLIDGDILETVCFQRAEVARRIENQLPDEVIQQFALVGKPYLINLSHVMRINAPRQTLTFDINQPDTCKKQSLKATTIALRTLRQRIDEPPMMISNRRKASLAGGFAHYRELACAQECTYDIGDDEVMILGR